MLGALWLVWRARSSTRAGALTVAVLAVYAWSLLSMLTTLVGTTLLSFRLQPTLTVLLAAAGAFGFIEATLAIAHRYQPSGRRVIAAAATLGAIGALTFSQDIPDVLRSDIVVAYTDTDGDGQRADRRPPGAERYYREIDERIQEVTGRPRTETVVLTADYSFLSYYPYYGFQGLTSHYANPLAQFEKRADTIEGWATLTDADQFIKALDALPWKPPSVFLMRRGADDTYTLRLASDVYPNQPNVRRYHVALDEALFDDPRFDVSDIGPFVLAIRLAQLGSTPVTGDGAAGTNHRTARLTAIVAGSGRGGTGDRHPPASGEADHRAAELAPERRDAERRRAPDRLRGHRPDDHRAVQRRGRPGRPAEPGPHGAVVDRAQAGPQGHRPRTAHRAGQQRPARHRP